MSETEELAPVFYRGAASDDVITMSAADIKNSVGKDGLMKEKGVSVNTNKMDPNVDDGWYNGSGYLSKFIKANKISSV